MFTIPAELRAAKQVRLAITSPDPDTGDYPARVDRPNVYWIRFADCSYEEVAGQEEIDIQERSTEAQAMVCNVVDAALLWAAYIPEETLIPVFLHRGQWFTQYYTDAGLYGKADVQINAGSHGAVSIWLTQAPDWSSPSVQNVDAWAPPPLTSGFIAAGDWVLVRWNAAYNRWLIEGAECATQSSS